MTATPPPPRLAELAANATADTMAAVAVPTCAPDRSSPRAALATASTGRGAAFS